MKELDMEIGNVKEEKKQAAVSFPIKGGLGKTRHIFLDRDFISTGKRIYVFDTDSNNSVSFSYLGRVRE
jgi:hypothetical protein